MDLSLIQQIYQIHIDQISQDLDSISNHESIFQIHSIDENSLQFLAETTKKIFMNENTLLELNGSFIIVGDIHGHILDLYRIIKQFDLPPVTKYLFLGDIIDRGPFSVECISLVFAMKILFPNHVYIIRGNHEFDAVSMSGGFFTEMTSMYSANLYHKFISTFQFLPLAALIGPILCLHGGLSPEFKSLQQIKDIQRPICDYSIPLLAGILWSDPSNEPKSYSSSRRGTGFFFGEIPLEKFLKDNNLKTIIRGHECVNGVISHWGGKLMTVFSASNYCGQTKNLSGCLKITENFDLIPIIFSPLRYIIRNDTINIPLNSFICQNSFFMNSSRSLQTQNSLNNTEFKDYLSVPSGISLPKLPTMIQRKRYFPKKIR